MATVTLTLTDSTDGGWPYFRWYSDSEEMTTALMVALDAMAAIQGKVRVDESKAPKPSNAAGAVDSRATV